MTDLLLLDQQDYTPVFLPFCQKGTPQLTLLIKMQEFCYDNVYFFKVFHKIVLLFYKSECWIGVCVYAEIV